MIPSLQKFGDSSWTQDKLERVRKYLVAYSTIMAKQNYAYAYIDAFAGTGYHELCRDEAESESLFMELEQPEVEAFLDGSARIALKVEPRFTRYVFVEKDPRKAAELEKLRGEFSDKADDIFIRNADANAYLRDLCRKKSWKDHRAVLFLDPFGMQLEWETLAAVAGTKAIDTWILFPVSAVNRLLKKDSKIPEAWTRRLDLLFGESGWLDVFFPVERSSLFGDEMATRRKKADMAAIGDYFNRRLSTIFAGVAPNP